MIRKKRPRKVSVTIQLDPDVLARIDKKAERNDEPRAQVIRRAVARGLR
jgi:predicted transcriptional regulator